MKSTPLVTVFTPVYNLEKYIEQTIRSILLQTFTNFEYIIIDDSSVDSSIEIIKKINDPRIRLIQNKTNKGIAYNRNLAIKEAKGEYLAMIDGDDLALPTRLEKQITFLEKNTNYGILGTGVINIDKDGRELNKAIKYSIPDEEIPARMLFNNYIATSSVMIRKSYIEDIKFKKDFIVAEDYEVWIRLIRRCKIGHIREPLTKYRIHDDSISVKKKQLMIDTEILLMKKQLLELNCNLTPDQFQAFYDLSKDNQKPYYEKFTIINQTISNLFNSNIKSKVFDVDNFRSLLFRYWHIFFLNIKIYNNQLLLDCKNSGMYKLLSKKEKITLTLKCRLQF